MSRIALSLVTLTSIYVLTLGRASLWDVLLGLAISAALLEMFHLAVIGRRPAPLPDLPARLVAFIPFTARIILDMIAGTWTVALTVVGLRPIRHPGIVGIPIEGRSHRGIATTALVTSLSPGSYFVGMDWEQGLIYFHFLDASDPEAIRRDLSQFYHRYQRHVVP